MTPEERKLVIELFDRLATLEDAERDPEAARLIRDGLRQAPNAAYALVQSVLVQDEALKRANTRIQELEGGGEAPARDTSFLGSMRDSLLGARASRGSVPSVLPGSGSTVPASGMSAAWRTGGTQPMSPSPMPAAPMPAGVAAPMGGSFLGTAASAAAGVIGGALLLDGIRSMMGQHPAAHAAVDPGTHAALDPGASTASPWSNDPSGGDLSRQAGLDDIGHPAGASDTRERGSGLMDDSGSDDADVDGADDADDGGFDMDDGVGGDNQ